MTKPIEFTPHYYQIEHDSLTLLLLEQWQDFLTNFPSESLLDATIADNAQMIFWHLSRSQRFWFTAWLKGCRVNKVNTCELIEYYYAGVARMACQSDPKIDLQVRHIRDTYESKPGLGDIELLGRLQYGIIELNKYLTGEQHLALQWMRTVRYINMLMQDVIETIQLCKTQPTWCANVEQLLLVYKQACERRVNEPRVPLLIPVMQSITNRTRIYNAFVNNLSNGVTTMTDTNPTAIAIGFSDLSEVIKNRDITIDSKITDIYGDRGVVCEVPAHVAPPANLRKEPAYQLNINGCGRVAMRFTGSRLGWINDISMHVDITIPGISVRDDVIELLNTVEFVPFENSSMYENEAIMAQEQLTKFITELQSRPVLERPEYSAEICFISVIPTVRQSIS